MLCLTKKMNSQINNVVPQFARSNELVQFALQALAEAPPDLRQTGDSVGEIAYVRRFLPTYVRTVSDIESLFKENGGLEQKRIIELGAFLGIVSKALALAGANVVACDIPEFFARENVRSFYERLEVPIEAFNLRSYQLPFESASQDCVIACETFEHLNFNPLPVFAEINRVLRAGGFFYIAMPNGAYILSRLRYLISGNSPGFTVRELFDQLDPSKNMVVGLHWKEYSLAQTLEMGRGTGFEVLTARTVDEIVSQQRSLPSRIVRHLIPGGDTQIVMFRKSKDFDGRFVVSADS